MFNLQSIAIQASGAALVCGLVFLIGHSAGHSAGVKAEQKREDKVAGELCTAAESTWVEVDAQGRPLPRDKWGKTCLAAVKDLAAFRAAAEKASHQALDAHEREQDQKTAADVAAAARQAASLNAAKRNMEAENAKVPKDDRVGGGWFARLNELGGLRSSGAAGPDGAVRGAEGEAPH